MCTHTSSPFWVSLVCVCVCRLTCGEYPTTVFAHRGRQVLKVRRVCYPSPIETNNHTAPHKYWLLIQPSTYQVQELNSTHLVAQGWIDSRDFVLSMMHAWCIVAHQLSASLSLSFQWCLWAWLFMDPPCIFKSASQSVYSKMHFLEIFHHQVCPSVSCSVVRILK